MYPDGLDQLDQRLKKRGLVGDLPKPKYRGAKEGKIIIDVTVDATGKVTGASYQPKGSTITDGYLIEDAKAAALKARFTEKNTPIEGGTITYIFRLKAE